MGDINTPTGANTLSKEVVDATEFSSQSNILANMEVSDTKGRSTLINQDSPSGTLERDSKDVRRKNSAGMDVDSADTRGFQRFDMQIEVSASSLIHQLTNSVLLNIECTLLDFTSFTFGKLNSYWQLLEDLCQQFHVFL